MELVAMVPMLLDTVFSHYSDELEKSRAAVAGDGDFQVSFQNMAT
jgi:hypothetical protein